MEAIHHQFVFFQSCLELIALHLENLELIALRLEFSGELVWTLGCWIHAIVENHNPAELAHGATRHRGLKRGILFT